MDTVKDWEKIKERYTAWWNHEETDRCLIHITGPTEKKKLLEPVGLPKKNEGSYFSLDYITRATEYYHATTFYAGDAFPTWPETQVPVYMSCMLDDVNVDEDADSLWQKPALTDEEFIDYQRVQFNPENKYYKFMIELSKLTLEKAKDKAVPLVNGYHSIADVTAAFRGTEQLLYDLYDIPEQVKASEKHFLDLGLKIYQDIIDIIQQGNMGYTNWVQAWCPGEYSMVQHDFAYMISESMFEEFFYPFLKEQISHYKYSLHHVDGEGNFKHVPLLCQIEGLTGMQILPGEGKPSPLHYLDTLRYVQEHGKNLQITLPAREVETALELLSPKGLLIATTCESEEEAKALLRMVEKKSLRQR